jgi:hypothetical protein
MQKKLSWLSVIGVLALAAGPARADTPPTLKAAAKAALAKYQDAVVTVKLVLKTGNFESTIEIAGTVLTPEGLTVVSDSATNPFRGFTGEGGVGRSEATDVKVLLKDGRELPAKFVLRDADLDLAFLQPAEKGLKLTHVKLEKVPVPQVLDDLIYVHRLEKSLNREASVTLGQATAVVKKPRLLVVPDLINGMQALGCPVFDGSGRPIGITVVRRTAGGQQGAISLAARQPVILSAEDVQEAANQAGKPQEGDK